MSNRKSDARSVDEYCAEHEADFVECRDTGHAWPPRPPMGYTNNGDGDRRSPVYSKRMECERCGLVRHKRIQYVGGTYIRIHPRYEYPDGYLAAQLGVTKDSLWRYQIEGSAEPKANGRKRRSRRLRSVS